AGDHDVVVPVAVEVGHHDAAAPVPRLARALAAQGDDSERRGLAEVRVEAPDDAALAQGREDGARRQLVARGVAFARMWTIGRIRTARAPDQPDRRPSQLHRPEDSPSRFDRLARIAGKA